jgi:hypothetical protein
MSCGILALSAKMRRKDKIMNYEVIKSGQSDPLRALHVLRGGFGNCRSHVFAKRTHLSAKAFPLTPFDSRSKPVKPMRFVGLPTNTRKPYSMNYLQPNCGKPQSSPVKVNQTLRQ